MKVFGFVGTDHLRTNIIINDETLEQVSQFNYLGCSKSYQFSNDMEFKFTKFLQLIGTIKRTIFTYLPIFFTCTTVSNNPTSPQIRTPEPKIKKKTL